ncbi:MAG TPA: hypothetical protein VHK90_05390 [Thermoanaerobaculia bacterium]|nr:hypothetical protein [Thermoanaerobaculia bacterium]
MTTGFRAAGAQQLLELLQKAFGAVHVAGDMQHAEIRLGDAMIELGEATPSGARPAARSTSSHRRRRRLRRSDPRRRDVDG